MIEQREKTGAQLAVRSKTDSRTMPAEWMRNRSDDADLSDSVVKRISAGGFAKGIRCQLTDGTELVQLLENLVHGNYHVRRPHTVFFQRHELDKADYHAFVAGESGELDNLILIEPAQKDRVYFDRFQTGALGRADSRQHFVVSFGHARNASEFLRIDGIHAHRGAAKS